ncbi:rod shape-determining protein MreC [Peptococcaceae bacterium 1198_IL3148]
MSRNNYKKVFLLVVFIVIVLIVINMTTLSRSAQTPLEVAVKDSLAPLQKVTMGISSSIKENISFIGSLGHLKEENQALKDEIRKLKSELNQVEEYKVQNRQFKELLNYREATAENYQLMSATVIGRDPGNWFGTITLNRGAADGVERDMAVVVPEGLVGRVVAVSNQTAEVLLITDPRSGVGSQVQQSRVPGVVEGIANSTGVVRMVHLPKNEQVKNNQVVISSGVGGVYPSGIRIGKIFSVEDDPAGLFKIATIKPFVNFNVLENVFIVKTVYKPEVNLSVEGME